MSRDTAYPLADARTTVRGGLEVPLLGLGLYKVDAADVGPTVSAGLDAGYRLVDGAAFYGTERELGEAVRGRDDVTVVSKFWGEEAMGYAAAHADFDRTEERLGLGRPLDLYLIHWPRPARDQYVDTWRGLLALRDAGRVRAVGVSNFEVEHLQRLVDETGEAPALNQVELHPWLPQRELRAWHEEHGVLTQAWSPLGRGRLLDEPVLVEIARGHGVDVARVLVRWHLQQGIGVLPKSTHPERIRGNRDVDGFVLSQAEMEEIAGLESGVRTGSHPAERN